MSTRICKECKQEKGMDAYRNNYKTCKNCNNKKYNDLYKETGYYQTYYKKNRHDLLTHQHELNKSYKKNYTYEREAKLFLNILL